MKAEITNAENSSELPLAEPHFDDEATVLSARRVVPLDEVPSYESQTKFRFARGWMFATIVLGSLLLGVVAGAAYYSYLNRGSAPSVADMDNIAAGVAGTSTEPSPNNDVRAREVNNTISDSNAEVTDKEGAASAPPAVSSNESKKSVARRVDVLTSPSNGDERLTHEERKAARREARERKRELERQSRRSRDDLTRIREIFEGPQRP